MERHKDHFLLKAKDHLVSHKIFSIYWDTKAELGWTDIDLNESMERYYASVAYDSHKSKKRNVMDWAYRFVQQLMFRYKWKKIVKHLNQHQTTALDYGGGTGGFSRFTKAKGIDSVLIEKNAKALSIAKAQGVEAYKSLDDLPRDRQFDLITLWHVLEHLPHPKDTLLALRKRLTKEGFLVVAVPNLNSADAKHYGAHWAALDVPRHLWHFSNQGLIRFLAASGFSLLGQYPLFFDAFYVALLSEKHKNGRVHLLRAFYQGLKSNVLARQNKHYSSSFFVFTKSDSFLV